MHTDFWHERWQRNQIGFHQDAINPHLQQFWPALGAAPGARVFVPLCGKSGDMLWLRAQGHAVVGIEISPLAVQAFFDENGLEAKVETRGPFRVYETDGLCLYCGDFYALAPADLAGVTAVYDRASLIAMPPAMRAAYAGHLRQLLAPDTRTLLVAIEYAQHEMEGPPFSVPEAEVRALYQDACSVERIHAADILEQEPRFRDKGLTRLQEKVYALTYNRNF
jgi:thiopurine S-methyltransferase